MCKAAPRCAATHMLSWIGLGLFKTRAISHLITAGDAHELVARPHAKDGADAEVSVDHRGAIERVKGH